MGVLKKLAWFFKKEKWSYFFGILALLLIAILNLLPVKIMGRVTDYIETSTLTKELLFFYVFSLLAIAISVYGLRYLWRICIFGSGMKLERKFRNDLFNHFTKMSSAFYHENRVGDLMAHATNDVSAIQRLAGGGILQAADAIITGTSVLLTMAFTISIKLTLVAIIPLPLMILGSRYLGKKLHATFFKAQEAFSEMNNRVHESVAGIKVTKAFGREEKEIEKFITETNDVDAKNMIVTRYDSMFDPLISTVVAMSFVLVFIFGLKLREIGEITTGNFMSFVTYIYYLIWPMLAFGFFYNTIERGSVAYERIEALLSIPPDITNHENALEIEPKGKLSVNIKEFSYPDNIELKILQNFKFDLLAGQTLGLVGRTGSGKSTLIKILLREYDNYVGKISFGEHELAAYDIHYLRKSIGYVPQEQFLFSMSILDNIRFAKPEASLEEVMEVAKVASVHEDIMGFEMQYDTLIGERGVSLSGGQRQRIAIARALLLSPELLILDDSLSAVDAKTEEAILDALKKNRKDKTTIISAHRLSAIAHAQLILVVEDGKISERGNHHTLMEEDGWYAEVYRQQELSKESK